MDIVQKLRSPDDGWSGNAVCVSSAVAEEGAAEIERLRAALDPARYALQVAADFYRQQGCLNRASDMLRAASRIRLALTDQQ